MIEDGMVPRLAVGQRWKTGLRLLLTDAVEVESSAGPRLRAGRGPRLSPTPTYEVVGRICPHPWDGWHVLDTGAVSFVARDESREFPANAMVRAWSPLLVDPNQWDDALKEANPRGWRRWLVRQVLEAPAFAETNAIYVELEAADVS
jgi:hypothetical protein